MPLLLPEQFFPPPPPLRGGAALYWQDAVGEDGHDGGTDEARDGHGHEPRHEDISEEAPIDCLPRPQPPDGHHRTHLETKHTSSIALSSPNIHSKRLILFKNEVVPAPDFV